MAAKERQRLTSPDGIACFVFLFTPQAAREDSKSKEPKYKMILSFEESVWKTDEKAKQLRAACIKAAADKFCGGDLDKAREQIKKGKLTMPWRDNSDYEENGFPFDRAGKFINFSSKEQPGVVNRRAQPITNPKEVYSGMTARCTYGVWAYDTNGNKGVTLFLNNAQKVKDGDRLAGRPDATDDFEAVEGEDGEEDVDVEDI